MIFLFHCYISFFFLLFIFLTNLHFNRRCKLAEATQKEKQNKPKQTKTFIWEATLYVWGSIFAVR